jgi:hypothetical protein
VLLSFVFLPILSQKRRAHSARLASIAGNINHSINAPVSSSASASSDDNVNAANADTVASVPLSTAQHVSLLCLWYFSRSVHARPAASAQVMTPVGCRSEKERVRVF